MFQALMQVQTPTLVVYILSINHLFSSIVPNHHDVMVSFVLHKQSFPILSYKVDLYQSNKFYIIQYEFHLGVYFI